MGSIEVLERKLNTLKRQESLNEEKIVEKREEISERQIIKDHVRKIFGKILLLKLQLKIYFWTFYKDKKNCAFLVSFGAQVEEKEIDRDLRVLRERNQVWNSHI